MPIFEGRQVLLMRKARQRALPERKAGFTVPDVRDEAIKGDAIAG